jgi:hypothetical protein
MIYINGHKFWVLIAFLLALSPEINAQSGGSLSLNEKSGADISAFFSNFIGIPFAEEEIDFLTAQVGRLDSVDALASVVAGYSLLEPKTFERLLAPPPEVSTYFTVGFLPRKDGSIKFDFFVNTAYATYTESENQALSAAVSASIIDYYNASSYFYSSIPDAIGVGAEVYLAYVNGYLEDMPFIEDGQTLLTAAAATENPALKSLVDDQGATHDVERNPYVKQGDAFIDVDLNQFTKNLEVKHRLNPLQVKFFLKDLKENGRFARAVLLNDDLVRAWKASYPKAAWRTNPGYLTKVSRYRNAGLEIVDEGGELIVKQTDGTVVGKLDVDDLDLNPENALKVKGQYSQRHFDPDKSGGPIVREQWQDVQIDKGAVGICPTLHRAILY